MRPFSAQAESLLAGRGTPISCNTSDHHAQPFPAQVLSPRTRSLRRPLFPQTRLQNLARIGPLFCALTQSLSAETARLASRCKDSASLDISRNWTPALSSATTTDKHWRMSISRTSSFSSIPFFAPVITCSASIRGQSPPNIPLSVSADGIACQAVNSGIKRNEGRAGP